MNRFDGRRVLVTGAAGDIGQATALLLAKEGARVAVFDRKLELLEETVRLCEEAGAEVFALGVDQTDRGAVEAGVGQVADAIGGVDALFANAGYGKFSSFLEQPVKEWQRHVDVNLTGTFHVSQVVARQMVAQRSGGSIVINASSGASQHSDLLGAYCATKAGLSMLATGMASELGNHRIRVNSVKPGVVETGMTMPMLSGNNGEAHRAVLLADTPVGRLGLPEDVAELVAFLLSDHAAFITGESVMIDGGQTIHGHPRWFSSDYRQDHEESWEIAR